jgi:hypothetical protein
MAKQELITHTDVLSNLNYDPDTGIFTWAVRRSGRPVGRQAGHLKTNGYVEIQINGFKCGAHRLAWFYVYGKWPPIETDHINGIKSDNRIANLRLSSFSQNQSNVGLRKSNTSGYKGVGWSKRKNKWKAYITINYKTMTLGYFNCPKEAHEAYCRAAFKFRGEFARTG